MLYTSTSSFTPALDTDWRNHLSHGDVVMFRSPSAGQPAAARPVARPCLVLDIKMIGARRCALLIPALPARRPASGDRSVTVSRGPEYRAAGLDRPARFPIRSRLIIPLSHEGFAPVGTSGTPVIGRLDGDAFERMNAERGRLQALRDIRADKERDHHPQRREPRRDRDFTVARRGQPRPISLSPAPAARRSS